MDRSAYRKGFGLKVVFLLVAGLWLAGCSGSSSSSSADGGDENPAEQQPPVETSPGEEPPVEEPPEEEPPQEEQPPAEEPTVNLSAAEEVVSEGDSATLSWNSQNATSCNASGGWSGARAVQGTATVGPLSQGTTFTLTCSGDGGNAVAMLSVSVLGTVGLEWVAPTKNVDGSPLSDLDGFRIYYGVLSGNYTDEVPVADEARTSHQMSLPSGSYYFAMTALDSQGNESTLSNEVVKVVN